MASLIPARHRGIPFLALKDISNNELRRASHPAADGWPSLGAVQDELGLRAALVVEAMLRAWSPPRRPARVSSPA